MFKHVVIEINMNGTFVNGKKSEETEIHNILNQFGKKGYKLIHVSDNNLTHIMVREESTKNLLESMQKTTERVLNIIWRIELIQKENGIKMNQETMDELTEFKNQYQKRCEYESDPWQ